MGKCKVFVPIGALGIGFSKESFEAGVQLEPDIIACDAGSTDSGPYYLGTGICKYARESVKEDLRMMVVAGHRLGIPVAVGSCGTCGTDSGVLENTEILKEICREEGLSLKVAQIFTQQNPGELKKKYLAGQITPLASAPDIDETTFDNCTNIVALAGTEPYMEALKSSVDVILCGRATDTAVIAALPLMKGCDPATVWHCAKIAECGGLCGTEPEGGVFLWFDENGVTIKATEPGNTCTVYSASAHMLYENSSPFEIVEPGVSVNVENAVYTQLDDGMVRITGAVIESTPYTLKLEGAAMAGYQTMSMVGIADKRIMENPMKWINSLERFAQERLQKVNLTEGYTYSLRPYGYNAVTGEVPGTDDFVPRELGLMLVTTADTQQLATKIAKVFNPILLHFSVCEGEPMPSFAFPFSPAEIEKGKVYEFKFNHVVHVANPTELIRTVYTEITDQEEE